MLGVTFTFVLGHSLDRREWRLIRLDRTVAAELAILFQRGFLKVRM